MKMLVVIGIVNFTSYLRRVNVHEFYKQLKIWADAYVSHLALKNVWWGIHRNVAAVFINFLSSPFEFSNEKTTSKVFTLNLEN